MVQAFDGEEEVETMKNAFYFLDDDYSGTIDVKELTSFLKETNESEDMDKMERWMDRFYLKERGVITFTE